MPVQGGQKGGTGFRQCLDPVFLFCHCEPIQRLDKLREAISCFAVWLGIAAVATLPRNDKRYSRCTSLSILSKVSLRTGNFSSLGSRAKTDWASRRAC